MKDYDNVHALFIALLVWGVYLFTTVAATAIHSLPLMYALAIYLVGIFLFKRSHTTQLVYVSLTIILLLVGTTGWFVSPFFSWLYLTAVGLAFIFHPVVSAMFIVMLMALFIPDMASRSMEVNLMMLTSLLAVIPFTQFLRIRYLQLKESVKDILVLEAEKKKNQSVVDDVLNNKVTSFSAHLREPVNDIKQMAYMGVKKSKTKKYKDHEARIILLADKCLQLIKVFEEAVTGRKLVK